MTTELTKQETKSESAMMEAVLLGGDLSKLTPAQRVSYYQSVCTSLGINPLTRPFDYITLNGKLTLYARKDAAEQLRKKHNISIGKPVIQFQDELIIVTVDGHIDGRTDSEVGVVKKSDMKGDMANAIMKAVTKAKRRLTLSICGLGFLDETEVESIKDAAPVIVDDNGEIETPIQKGIRLYRELAEEADQFGINAEALPDNVTIDQVRSMYKDLQQFVKDAKNQAVADEEES